MTLLTRRVFLRTGILGTAGFALGTQLDKLLYAFEKDGDLYSFQKAIRPFTLVPSICHQCQAGCGLLGMAVDEELIGILGNPRYPNNKGGLCARAIGGVNLVYDPERILYPLKRKKERGGNQWERISWQEAIQEISSRLAELISKGQNQRFVVQMGVDEGATPAKILLKKIGLPALIDDLYLRDLNSVKAHELVWGEEGGVADVAHSQTILNFGSNPYESHESYIPFVQRLISARINNHAKLITFDVRLSNTAGRSDEWYPVRPGTDMVIILAICKQILDRGLADKTFLTQWTNLSPDQILSYLAPYKPQMAEKESGIPAKEIIKVANDFATFKPSVAFCGSGLTHQRSGTYHQMAILLLNALVGNIDQKGGYCLPKRVRFEEPDLPSIVSGIDHLIDEEKRSIGFYLTYLSNPVYANPSGKRIGEILKDEKLIPFYAAADTHITETSLFADIILPVATQFESWGLDSRQAVDRIPYIGLRQPLTKPRGEAVSFSHLLGMIGKRVKKGVELDEKGYIQAQLKKIIGLEGSDGIKRLEKDGFWMDPNLSPPYESYRPSGFKTPSRKMELYVSKLKKEGLSPFPAYKENDKKSNLNNGELFLTAFSKNVAARYNPNSKWLSEIFHENPLWINEKTAGRLGIIEGEKVEIHSKGMKTTVCVHLSQSVHPEVVAIARDLGHWAYGHAARGKKFKSPDADTSLIWWDHGKSFHVNWLIQEEKDRVSGGLSGTGTVVKIKKSGG
ncbi:MAG: molybdopterin-dependent oxidoreductase [Thermodesulfobacteriota bacterium]